MGWLVLVVMAVAAVVHRLLAVLLATPPVAVPQARCMREAAAATRSRTRMAVVAVAAATTGVAVLVAMVVWAVVAHLSSHRVEAR